MSRLHGWYPKPKFTCGLNVSQEHWDSIFKKGKGDLDKSKMFDEMLESRFPKSLTNKRSRRKTAP